ncbi:hypothetical protein [Streptomyces sp. NPDC002564]
MADRAGEANAGVTRNVTRIVWVAIGVVFILVAAVGAIAGIAK